jgi:uncharacterized protein YjbI with pentapeptide repeats
MKSPLRLKATIVAAMICLSTSGALAQPRAGADSPSRSLDRQGEAYMREGDYDAALSSFAKALALEANNARAIILSAQVRWLTVGAQAKAQPVDLQGTPLEAQDFSRIVVSGLTLANVHGPRSDWTLARLEGVNLNNAQLFEADFSRAHFLRVTLDRAVLDRAILRDADFSGTSMLHTRAPNLSAERAVFARMRAIDADFDGSDFTGADFSGADLRASRFGRANLAAAKLLNADLRGADLARANLASANLKGARVDCATRLPTGFNADAAMLVPLDLCGGAYALDFRGKDVAGVSFRDLDLRGALFAGAQLGGADFAGANLDGADFEGASGFDGAFTPASAREASFEGVKGPLNMLGRTDLRNARISGPAGAEVELTVGPSGPRTEGAALRNLSLVLDYRRRPGEGAAGLGFASLLFARVEASSVNCAPAPARGRRDEGAALEWSAFAESVDTARRVAASNPGATLGESCRRAVQAYLSDNCEAGFRAAGVRYACPGRR